MEKKIELLAPAQNKECGILAIKYGADSVYIGANAFGARKNAANSIKDIEEVINYAHKFSAKVYVTINTILSDSEIKDGIRLIRDLDSIGADGIIFQDMGILEAAKRGELPPIKLIASTQCDIRSLEKVKFFENAGVGRVILARELSLEQIKKICKNTKAEVETFIHGALCVSYSGQCYLSHKIGGRSANRGECAQACRKKYSLVNDDGKILIKDKPLLSLKDFMGAKRLRELILAGVTSFKIEGRLKDENYIKNTVSYYRKALDEAILECSGVKKLSSGKVFYDFESDPRKSFNRGFSEYFLSGDRKKAGEIWNLDLANGKGEYIGVTAAGEGLACRQDKKGQKAEKTRGKHGIFIKTDKKINPQDGLCYVQNGELTGFLVNSSVENKGGVTIFPNTEVKIPAGTKIFRNKDASFEDILRNSRTERKISVDFKIYDGEIECIDEDGNSIKTGFSKDNEAKNIENTKESWIKGLKKAGGSDFYVNSVNFSATTENTGAERVYFLPTAEINALRREIFEKLSDLRLKNYEREKQGEISYAEYPLSEGDYRLNVHNLYAENFYEKCGTKVIEKSLESGQNPCGKEIMRTKHCIRYMLNICKKNPDMAKNADRELFLVDSEGVKYGLCFDCKNCEMAVISP